MDGLLDHCAFSEWRGAVGRNGRTNLGVNMTRRELLTAAATLPALRGQAMNSLTPKEKAAGWQLLFDGSSFEGWEDTAAKQPAGDAWTIEDHCLKPTGKPRIIEDL